MAYNKTNFREGDILTANHMNGIEDGIIAIEDALDDKQDKLRNGVNLKTINGESLLGSGNITIKGTEGSGTDIIVDDFLSSTSTNPVQNKVLNNVLKDKQDILISGTTIKTINNQTLLGGGNIDIIGNGTSITVDTELNLDSEYPVQNKVITAALNEKQDKLISGTDIKTINGQSLLGSGDISIEGSDSTSTKLPSYWQEYINTKATEINTLNSTYGYEGEAFVFLTDTHIPNNYGYSTPLINEIAKKTSVRKVFFGGDMVASAGSVTNMTTKWRELSNGFDDIVEVHPMRGNHDADYSTPAKNIWDAAFRTINRYCVTDGGMNYYRDDTATKVRFIVIDSIYSEGNADKTLGVPNEKTLLWMQERILELPVDWHVLIVTHSVWISTGGIGNSGQAIIDAIDAIYDTTPCTIIGIMCGHCHSDRSTKFEKGYIAFSTKQDFKGGTAGSTTEQAFDVVNIDLKNRIIRTIRIGSGSNRQIAYERTTSENVTVTGIRLEQSAEVSVNGSYTLNATLEPSNATNKQVVWNVDSGTENIVITTTGLKCVVKGVKEGSATVSVTTVEGNLSATCAIEVKAVTVTGVTLSSSSINVTAGKSKTLTALIVPSNASNTNVTWSIVSGNEYVSIEPSGLYCTINGITGGSAVIKVATEEGGYEASCSIQVIEDFREEITADFAFNAPEAIQWATDTTKDTNYVHSDYVDISAYSSLDMATPVTTNASTSHASCAFYDVNKTFINGVKLPSGAAWSWDVRKFEIPSNAVYVRATWFGAAHPYKPAGASFTCYGNA